MGDFRIPDPASQATKGSDGFFRWRAASIILNTIALLYWLVALGYVWIGSVFSERGSQHMAHLMYWGALYNVVIAVLCFAGRQMSAAADTHFSSGRRARRHGGTLLRDLDLGRESAH